MAKVASLGLLLILFSGLSICTSGTVLGFSYDVRMNSAVSAVREAISLLKLNGVSPSSIRVLVKGTDELQSWSNADLSTDLFLDRDQLKRLKLLETSWLKTDILALFPHLRLKSIVVGISSHESRGHLGLKKLGSNLKSIHSVLNILGLDQEVKLYVALPSSFWYGENEEHLQKVIKVVSQTRSHVSIQGNFDRKSGMTENAKRVVSVLSHCHHNKMTMVLRVKSSAIHTASKAVELILKLSRSMVNVSAHSDILQNLDGIYIDMGTNKQMKQMAIKMDDMEVFHYNHKELLSISSQFFWPGSFKAVTVVDVMPPGSNKPMIVTVPGSSSSPVAYSSIMPSKPANDPIITPKVSYSNDRKLIARVSYDVFPTTPVTNPTGSPVVVPPESTTPMIVTVPGSGTSPVIPSTPLLNPGTYPPVVPITPVPDPNLTPVPVATPVTTTPPAIAGGMQPVTNPVTTPSSGVNVPVTSPATASSPPLASGQTWRVVKNGVQQSVIQAALDYACGIGGADCSMIQQGAPCFNPATLQSHASYAFNSYYQKNPAPTSCNFGGAAMLVTNNPSSGSCVYPASSSSTPSGVPSSTTSPTTVPITSPTTVPTSTPTTVPTASSSNGGMVPGASVGGFVPGTTMSPPTVVNSGDPGSLNPAIYPDSPSGSISAADSQSVINRMLLVLCLVPLAFIFDI